MFVEQSTQELRILLVVSPTNFANTVERAEGAGVSLSSKHHHLIRVDVHSNVLHDRHKSDINHHRVDRSRLNVHRNLDISLARSGR